MMELNEARRIFIKRAAFAAAALPLLVGCRGDSWAQRPGPESLLEQLRRNAAAPGAEGRGAAEVPDKVSWRTELFSAAETGERMIISGTVFQPDGRTPAPNTLIYFYHTDIHGYYGRNGEPKHGRYRGWMLTDAQGRYEFSSIRPASYPGTTIAAHVHMTVTTLDQPEDWIDSILFEGDRFIDPRERASSGKKGGFNPIVKLATGTDGIGRATRDIRLWKV